MTDQQSVAATLELTRVGIVVGEASGDTLGAGLMRSLKAQFPDCEFEGVGGPKMIAEGFNSLYKLDRLAVMGLIDPLKRLPELLRMRKGLREHFIANPPDIFIGIDAPDFNLTLEQRLREAGITTAHYVSPSVWAWRQKRVFKVAQAVDLMLTLFPFEARFYQEHNIPVNFIGHTLADQIPLHTDRLEAQQTLGLTHNAGTTYVALLPGSRAGEIETLGREFLLAAELCIAQRKDLHFLVPAANSKRFAQLEALLKDFPDLPVSLFLQQSHAVMAAANVVVMASGTTTLEAMLLKRPMVIAYRMSKWAFAIVRRMVKVKFFGLPNLLADRLLVPELLQDEVNAESLAREVLHFINDPAAADQLTSEFEKIHLSLRRNADASAAAAICQLVAKKQGRRWPLEEVTA
ncbi:lipid-A-disaccharide synthase [Teredinibacter turnerae]|uniref:lipid-A-disaccharide synthase n=1 Tax=Teredinibacter turnerae TaxID=2426 RepID=UPI00035EF41A|nr:lipid-A-disaccharide synthase [Teredinibacter turnerae]